MNGWGEWLNNETSEYVSCFIFVVPGSCYSRLFRICSQLCGILSSAKMMAWRDGEATSVWICAAAQAGTEDKGLRSISWLLLRSVLCAEKEIWLFGTDDFDVRYDFSGDSAVFRLSCAIGEEEDALRRPSGEEAFAPV